ncbi:MAG: hypothetical protein M1827_004308 [Pycnora praestabilis]|nr:MAG: hypothetical protein M1827_004308 [Pycnora praestabilis]
MSTQTPRRSLARPRPSLNSQSLATASSPNLAASYSHPPLPNPQLSTISASAALARKASLHRLTSSTLSTVPDGSIGYGLGTIEDEASPLQTKKEPTTPAMKRAPSGGDGIDIEEGDSVNVPGGMYGTVKFIGSVKGKKGVFAGVELSREWAPRGKNDGSVEGVQYFRTSVPGSGIFLPLDRASKRASPALSPGSFPPTPTTPSLGGISNGNRLEPASNAYTPPTPAMQKFSQSLGPGRAASPQLKPKSRPSLPRPESPLRRNQNLLTSNGGRSTPAGRPSLGTQASSRNGAGTARYAPSPTPGKYAQSLQARRDSLSGGDPTRKIGDTPKIMTRTPAAKIPLGSRSSSRLEQHSITDEDAENTPIGVTRTNDSSYGRMLGLNGGTQRTSAHSQDEVERLKAKLEKKDKQLREQAASLLEMEKSFAELQSLLPSGDSKDGGRAHRGSGFEDADASQLRALLREKNEKIAILTTEFDTHRADFRSTIDTLELASTETERVYEKKVEDLLQEVRELQDRGEDVESVARQLKQLEELVQELEEGLEDARRGEAEARGEVEFLRGEVERGRSELRREREKAADALRGAGAAVDGGMSPGGSKEVEQRDDEIRGLKAIIHSLSRDSVPDMGSPKIDSRRASSQRHSGFPRVNGVSHEDLAEERYARETLEREVKELQGLIERKTYREEELEREIERVRREAPNSQRASAATLGSNGWSERTPTQGQRSSAHDSKGTLTGWHEQTAPEAHRHGGGLEAMPETESYASSAEESSLWCEICETGGHDILTCTNMFGHQANGAQRTVTTTLNSPPGMRTGRDVVMEGLKGLSVGSPNTNDKVAPLSPAKKIPAVSPAAHSASLPNPMDTDMVAGKTSGVKDADRWCALCERDGHESVDCPFDDEY